MKKSILIAIAFIILLVTFVYFWGGTGDALPKDAVVSDDGRAFLVIPDEALPDGVARDDISISEIPTTYDEALVQYQLAPEGTVLKEPVELTIEVDAPDVIPLLYHHYTVKGETYTDVVPNVSIAVDGHIGKAVLSGALMHFSTLEVAPNHFVTFTRHVPTSGIVNEPVPISGQIGILEDYGRGGRPGTILLTKRFTISGEAVGFDAVEGGPAVDMPKKEVVYDRNTRLNMFYDDFTCAYEGEGEIVWNFELIYQDGWNWPFVDKDTGIEYASYDEAVGIGILEENLQPKNRKPNDVLNIISFSHPINCTEREWDEAGDIGFDVEPDGTVIDADGYKAVPNEKGDDVYTQSVTNGSGEVLMVQIDGAYYPENQFMVGAAGAPEPDHSCGWPHYHAVAGDIVYGLSGPDSLEVVELPDPFPTDCGYGYYETLERVHIPVSLEQRGALKEKISSF